MFKALKLEEIPVIASSNEGNFPSHDYITRKRHRMIEPFYRIDEFKMNFKFTFIKTQTQTQSVYCSKSFTIMVEKHIMIVNKVRQQAYDKNNRLLGN